MRTVPSWHYNELRHIGVDYSDPAIVAAYEDRHRQFGDTDEEFTWLLDRLDLQPEHTIIDIGAGTGRFTLAAARRCAHVYAVDVSQPMLDHIQRKADAADIGNITCCRGGFLTYEHDAEPVDRVVSMVALHHIPDFWKLVGLQRIAGMLKDGGLFYLQDVIFSFDPRKYIDFFEGVVNATAQQVDADCLEELQTHFREEFSTFDWVIEGFLTRAGFTIEQQEYRPNGMWAQYYCRK